MIKINMLVGLALGIAAVAMSAAPAGAWFKSLNQAKTTGLVTVGETTLETPGAKIGCESAHGEWSVQTKGQFKDHKQGEKQLKTTFGPNLYVKILQWNDCKADVVGIKVPFAIEPCTLQLREEQKGLHKDTLSFVTECVAKIPAIPCSITLFAGTQQPAVNAFLKEVSGKNEGQSVFSTANVEGIHGKATCEASEFVNGKFLSEANGLKAQGLELA